jgi:putative ABC transport system permease protein
MVANVVFAIVIVFLAAALTLLPFYLLLTLGSFLAGLAPFARATLLVTAKNLRRNLWRTSMTYLATFVLASVAAVIWSVLYYLDQFMAEKADDTKVVVTEKWQVRSQMPFYYASSLQEGAASPLRPEDVRPQDSMTWQIYLGSLDPTKESPDNLVVCIALEPHKLMTMMDGLWDEMSTDRGRHRKRLTSEETQKLEDYVRKMEADRRSIIIGPSRLAVMNKRVGERITLTGVEYKGINLEFEIVGVFPAGRYSEVAVINRDYLNDALNSYPASHGGVRHPLADKSLNVVWLQVPAGEAWGRLAEQIDSSGLFSSPPVKCQTLAAEAAAALESFQDLVWGLRWLLSPAILATMALVLANSIGISVRERRTELAVLKVLGFRPRQILASVLGESVVIGALGGSLSAALIYLTINQVANNFADILVYVPDDCLWWGPALGALVGLGGSLVPAWSACAVKTSEVFARAT